MMLRLDERVVIDLAYLWLNNWKLCGHQYLFLRLVGKTWFLTGMIPLNMVDILNFPYRL